MATRPHHLRYRMEEDAPPPEAALFPPPSSTYVSPAKAKIEELQSILSRENYMADPLLDPYRELMMAAHNSANGGGANIRDLSTTVVLLAHVMTLKELREPARLKEDVRAAVAEFHVECPGKTLEPVVQDVLAKLEKLTVAPEKKDAEADSQIMTPFGFTLKGPVVKMTVKYLFLGGLMIGAMCFLLMRQDERLRKNFTEQVMPVALEIAKNQLLKTPAVADQSK